MASSTALLPDIHAACDEAWTLARQVTGGLTEREVRFLALAMACTPAKGATIEIGSFKGRSTVALGAIARRYGRAPIVAVDPHTGPSVTDPPLGVDGSSYDEFMRNLRSAGVLDQIEVHRTLSRDLARGWEQPIRLLWIDGDHTYEGAREDWTLFGPHLAPGAVIALHDVLHSYEGPVRIFAEEVLRSDDFGAAGIIGSIGWAQYRPGDAAARRQRAARHRLAARLGTLIPYTEARPLGRLGKLRYKLHRSRVPHAAVTPEQWIEAIS